MANKINKLHKLNHEYRSIVRKINIRVAIATVLCALITFLIVIVLFRILKIQERLLGTFSMCIPFWIYLFYLGKKSQELREAKEKYEPRITSALKHASNHHTMNG